MKKRNLKTLLISAALRFQTGMSNDKGGRTLLKTGSPLRNNNLLFNLSFHKQDYTSLKLYFQDIKVKRFITREHLPGLNQCFPKEMPDLML